MKDVAETESSIACPAKIALFVAYKAAADEYAKAVGILIRVQTLRPEYGRLDRETDDARFQSVAARKKLDKHIAEHGC